MRKLSGVVILIGIILCGCRPTEVIYQKETLQVSLSSGEDYLTSQEYSGWVTITVSGTGSIVDGIFTDGLFKFTDQGELHPYDKEPSVYGIAIDGIAVCCDILQRPPFSNLPDIFDITHVYRFGYYVRGTPRQIAFRSAEFPTADNTGVIEVEVSTEPLFRGR